MLPCSTSSTHGSRNEMIEEEKKGKKPVKALRQRTKERTKNTKQKTKKKKKACIAPLLVTADWWVPLVVFVVVVEKEAEVKVWNSETVKCGSWHFFEVFFLVFNEYEKLFSLSLSLSFFFKKKVSFEVWLVCRCWSLEEHKKEDDKRFFIIFGHCFSIILMLILWLLSTR
jgi:L-lactate permease